MFQFLCWKEAKAVPLLVNLLNFSHSISSDFQNMLFMLPSFLCVGRKRFYYQQIFHELFMNEFYNFHNKLRFFSRSLLADFLYCSMNYCLRANTVQSNSMIRIESNGIFLLRFPILSKGEINKLWSAHWIEMCAEKNYLAERFSTVDRDSNICEPTLGASPHSNIQN